MTELPRPTHSRNDLHDYDGLNKDVFLDIAFKGKQRGVLLHPDRNGYV